MAYDSFTGVALGNDSENRIRSIELEGVCFAATRKVLVQRGMIWVRALSIIAASFEGDTERDCEM